MGDQTIAAGNDVLLVSYTVAAVWA